MVVHSAGLRGDWQRPPVVGLRHDPPLFSSATPSDTKNRYFSGAEDVPAPGALIALLIAGKILMKFVSWSVFSFWPLTVIRSMAPAAVLALDSEVASWNRVLRPQVDAGAPKS